MELSGLAKLGKIGGIAGIGLGMAVLLFGDIMKDIGVLPENWRGPILVLIILSVAALAGHRRIVEFRHALIGRKLSAASLAIPPHPRLTPQ